MELTNQQILDALEKSKGNKKAAAKLLGLPETTYRRRLESIGSVEISKKERVDWRETKSRDTWVIESNDSRICNADDAIKKAGVDLDIWEVEKVVVGGWDVTMKLRDGETDKPYRSQNQQIKIYLRRKVPLNVEVAVENLLERLRKKSPIVKRIKRKEKKRNHRRSLEVSPVDAHFGLRCYKPGADADWNPDMCRSMLFDTVEEILELSKPYAPFEQVVIPIGNDFFHIDNIWGTTTAGTGQPEADSYHNSFVTGETIAIELIEMLKEVADVIAYMVPGNHDRQTSFMLGRILNAYFKNDKNVTVHADSSPYKFHRFGVNLIGYEHGHSVKPSRLAALMANECPEDWAKTKNGYREWHLGDQHRKGSMSPITFEEQGVSIEYLPSIVAPNEWHRLKGFNWQKRGTMAFVWDYEAGPIARLQVNIDRYLNKIMGK